MALRPTDLSEDAAWVRVAAALGENEAALRSEGLDVEVGDLKAWALQGPRALERAIKSVIERVRKFGE